MVSVMKDKKTIAMAILYYCRCDSYARVLEKKKIFIKNLGLS